MLPDSEKEVGPKKRKGGMDFLRTEDLSTSPEGAKILGVKFDGEHKFGPSVIIKLALNGHTKFWTVNIKRNPNYKILTAAFGRDENNWVDKKVLLFNEEDEFSGQYFPRVEVHQETSTKKGR